MRERTLQFGDRRRLAGTFTIANAGIHPVGFVLLNAGVISRVGPQRLNVCVARALAQQGHAVLRFDLSGLGESRTASGTAAFEAQAIADTRDAVSALAREFSVSRVVLFGLCSGSDNAFATALVDERVCGLVMLDPYVYPTRTSVLRGYALRLQQPGALVALSRALATSVRQFATRYARKSGQPVTHPEADSERVTPTRQEFARQLNVLLDRGVAIYLMYSGSASRHYNASNQFERVFGRALSARLDVEFQPQVNHTRTELAAQRDLIERVQAWARRRFAPGQLS